MMPPIPLYEGTRPYQTIPFQWSLHAATGDGVLHHMEFLADGVAASAAFLRLVSGDLLEEEVTHLRAALLAYCHRDTMAMVEVPRDLAAGGSVNR